MREATGSAAAPAARCRKPLRGSFIIPPGFSRAPFGVVVAANYTARAAERKPFIKSASSIMNMSQGKISGANDRQLRVGRFHRELSDRGGVSEDGRGPSIWDTFCR